LHELAHEIGKIPRSRRRCIGAGGIIRGQVAGGGGHQSIEFIEFGVQIEFTRVESPIA